MSGRRFSKAPSLAGYMTSPDGREVVFGLSGSGATHPQVSDGLVHAGDDVADVAAAFQQSRSKSPSP